MTTESSAIPVADAPPDGLPLPGLDGANPLGFLAGLGVVRAVDLAGWNARLSWHAQGGSWVPIVQFNRPHERDELVRQLARAAHFGGAEATPATARHRQRFAAGDRAVEHLDKRWKRQELSKADTKARKKSIEEAVERSRLTWINASHAALALGDDILATRDDWRAHLQRSLERSSRQRRFDLDHLAALGTELTDDKGRIRDTALRTMSGAGHQHFLRFASNVLARSKPGHFEKVLFYPWVYDDPVRNLTLRFDPQEDARYALRWSDPSKEDRSAGGGVLGANALAVLGMHLLATVPVGGTTKTTGFLGRGANDTYLRWPIWQSPLSQPAIGSLLRHPDLFSTSPEPATLRSLGVLALFQSARVTVGKYRNFTPAKCLA
jgi:hypothetical protein